METLKSILLPCYSPAEFPEELAALGITPSNEKYEIKEVYFFNPFDIDRITPIEFEDKECSIMNFVGENTGVIIALPPYELNKRLLALND